MKPYKSISPAIAKVIGEDYNKHTVIIIGMNKDDMTNDVSFYSQSPDDNPLIMEAARAALRVFYPANGPVAMKEVLLDDGLSKRKTND